MSELLSDLEAALEAEDARELAGLFHPASRLSDWRSRPARGPAEVRALYRKACEAYRATSPFRLEDGREVRLGSAPQVALDFRFVVESVRELGDTAAVVDGTWWTEDGLSPSGARLTGQESRSGVGGPPYSGAYRLVVVLSGGPAAVSVLHLDPYRAAPAPASREIYFGTTYENFAWGFAAAVCTIHPDGTVTVSHGDPDRAGAGGAAEDTIGRLPADSVARYARQVDAGIETEPGPPVGGGTADFGTVVFWALAPSGLDSAEGRRWRAELARAGDVRRPPASVRTRELAGWIYRSLESIDGARCRLLDPLGRKPAGSRREGGRGGGAAPESP